MLSPASPELARSDEAAFTPGGTAFESLACCTDEDGFGSVSESCLPAWIGLIEIPGSLADKENCAYRRFLSRAPLRLAFLQTAPPPLPRAAFRSLWRVAMNTVACCRYWDGSSSVVELGLCASAGFSVGPESGAVPEK